MLSLICAALYSGQRNVSVTTLHFLVREKHYRPLKGDVFDADALYFVLIANSKAGIYKLTGVKTLSTRVADVPVL